MYENKDTGICELLFLANRHTRMKTQIPILHAHTVTWTQLDTPWPHIQGFSPEKIQEGYPGMVSHMRQSTSDVTRSLAALCVLRTE